MSALPRPDIPPGPHRELVDALHDLHHRAGWPSLRRMAAAVGSSHTTVSKAFSHPALPSWGTVELLVETLGGDVGQVHDLWVRASSGHGNAASIAEARIAGRQAELAAVRRHVATGSGLLIVTGEAGIGKTKVVLTARQTSDVVVAVGRCLPLSAQAPLMPIGEALRALHDGDGGRLLGDALALAPAYVRGSLARLVPELADGTSPDVEDDFSRHRLFAAVSTCLSQVHALGGIGLLLEDVHWADTATLDLLEHLVAAGTDVPIVATWRVEDPDTEEPQRDWWLRIRRLPAVASLDLPPLTREESGEQCRLLGLDLDEPSLDTIHGRTRGQPLFTEQLAVHAPTGGEIPAVLADLLDRRLERLDDSTHAITAALGVADRGLSPAVLTAVTGLDERALVDGLRSLTHTHLLAPTSESDEVQLRHPLLAEAVRQRLVPAEATAVHRRLAEVMGTAPGADAAEMAEHWRGAGDAEQELESRIVAARAAGARWAAAQEADQWLRALDVWPESRTSAGAPPLTRPEAYLAAIDALKESMQYDRAAVMSAAADVRFPDAVPELRAEFLRRAAMFRTETEGPEVGLGLVEQALVILSAMAPGPGMVAAMARKHQLLLRLGRYDDAIGVARETAAAAAAAGEHQTQRLMLGHVAWHEAVVSGGRDRASATLALARSVSADDPAGDIWLAVIWTDALLVLGAPATEVVAAGRDALALAEERGITNFGTLLVRYNMARSLIDHASTTEAVALLGPELQHDVDLDRAPLFALRAQLETLEGRLDDAAGTLDALCPDGQPQLHDLDAFATIATVELWCERPQSAWACLQPALEAQVDSLTAAQMMPLLVLAARAAADLAERGEADGVVPRLVDLHNRATVGRSEPEPVTARALAATWSAELARLHGADSTRLWLAAASEWGTLSRRHDAAYCLWRAALAEIRDGHGTAAARLLERAAADARGHVPLRARIAAARSGPGDRAAATVLRGSAAPP